MAIWTIAKKEFRLLVRDRRAALLLVATPLLFILILGLLLGESFGEKPEDLQRVYIVDRDQGTALEETLAWFTMTPTLGRLPAGADAGELTALSLVHVHQGARFPYQPWSKIVQRDLAET